MIAALNQNVGSQHIHYITVVSTVYMILWQINAAAMMYFALLVNLSNIPYVMPGLPWDAMFGELTMKIRPRNMAAIGVTMNFTCKSVLECPQDGF